MAALAVPAAADPASHPLTMAITGSDELFGSQAGSAAARMRAFGIRKVAAAISWAGAAPRDEPQSWDPTNPNDLHYHWAGDDARIKAIVAAGFDPIVKVNDEPLWARIAPNAAHSPPTASKFGAFMRAAAERYSGKYPGVPRVRYWQIWNEPNLSIFLAPQYDAQTKKFTSPDVYRDMVNAGAASIHAVHADNLVIAGETAPFRDITRDVLAIDKDWGPLKFMRRMLCISDAGKPTCRDTVSFDVWSTHPYTSGGPTHHAAFRYDVSLGDLSKMRAALQAGIRAGHVKSARPVRFWVTEFSWDSTPPDGCSPPISLLKRWVPEAFYRMWASGINVITWFKLMDDPLTTSFFQSGLLFHAPTVAVARAKGFVEGFRFPFVALRRGRHVFVWAHTPLGKRERLSIQQTFRGGWTQVNTLRADRYGIAQALLDVNPVGRFRAVLASGEKSLSFSMRVPPDHFYNPFGQTVLLEPGGKPCTK
jgi:hypothetical protein